MTPKAHAQRLIEIRFPFSDTNHTVDEVDDGDMVGVYVFQRAAKVVRKPAQLVLTANVPVRQKGTP
jgi:hypothetical protein